MFCFSSRVLFMIMKYNILVLVVLIFVMSSSVFAQDEGLPASVVTVQEAVRLGVSSHPEYGIVVHNRKATEQEDRQAEALYYPSVDIFGDTGFEYTDDEGTRNNGSADDEEELYRYDLGVTLTQHIFDGGDTKYENVRQEKRVLSSTQRVIEAQELIGLAVVETYLEVIRDRKLLQIARQNVQDHLNTLRQIEDSAKAGRSTGADADQALARLAAARATAANFTQQLRTSEANYIRETGMRAGELAVPLIPVHGLSSTVEEQVQTTLSASPTIAIFDADVEVADAEMNQAESPFYPDVELQLNARSGRDLGGVRGEDTSAAALMVMNWNLYRGGSDSARKREFFERKREALESYNDALRDVEQDVRSTWAGMLSAEQRAAEFRKQANHNALIVKSYMDQFQLDRRTLLDVLDAQNELFVSRSNAVNEEFDRLFNAHRLVALKGELLNALGVQIDVEPTASLSSIDG